MVLPTTQTLGVFFATLFGLFLAQIGLAFLDIPPALLLPANFFVTVLFVAAPILALYRGAAFPFKWFHAVLFILVGVGGQYASRMGPLGIFSGALGNLFLACWCVGLGALLATLLREKNMILPIALFLALLDIFLVLTPVGPTAKFVKENQKTFSKVAYQVPKASTKEEKKQVGRAAPAAFVGPADWIFLSMFFVCLFKFGMRTRETMKWMIPTLIGYLAIVLFTGLPLPALLPIGACVLIVNAREFRLTKDEKVGVAVAVALGLGLIAFGLTRAKQPEGEGDKPSQRSEQPAAKSASPPRS